MFTEGIIGTVVHKRKCNCKEKSYQTDKCFLFQKGAAWSLMKDLYFAWDLSLKRRNTQEQKEDEQGIKRAVPVEFLWTNTLCLAPATLFLLVLSCPDKQLLFQSPGLKPVLENSGL